jgi:hypothetical protein
MSVDKVFANIVVIFEAKHGRGRCLASIDLPPGFFIFRAADVSTGYVVDGELFHKAADDGV